jgi:two-component system response regulator DevR
VIALIAEGDTNKEIVTKLGLSEKTVKNYIVSIFGKLQIERRTQAAALYMKAQHQNSIREEMSA